jgi:hypothetical protein
MNPSKLQPAVLGGVAIGVLSSLPVVNVVNVCCCAWVVFGGAMAAYLMQQNHPQPISAGDGAVVGLMAGAIGAVVWSLISIPIAMAMGPFQARFLERLLESANDLPPEARNVLEQMRGGMMGGALAGIGFIISLVFSLCLYSVFGLLGGLIGAVTFKKDTPPPVPPSAADFNPSTFTPPSSSFPPPPPPAG